MPYRCGARSTSILIVHQRPDQLDLLAADLRGMGVELRFATAGRMAADCMNYARPDAVVLDTGLPSEDGFDPLYELRKLAGDVPVILLGAEGAPAAKAGVPGEGAMDYYLAVPLQAGELRTKVQRLLADRGQEPASGGQSRADAVSLPILMRDLDRFLYRGNTRALGYLPRLSRAWNGSLPPQWPTLVEQVEGYEFRQARRTLEHIAHRLGISFHDV